MSIEEVKNRPHRNRLVISINEINYAVCSMDIDILGQFYYHFQYPKKSNHNKFLDYNRQKSISQPDHISFHKDGTVHLTLKKTGENLYKRNMPWGTFIPATQTACIPLLVHSIYQHNGVYMLPKAGDLSQCDENLQIVTNKLLFSSPQNFSVVLFLTQDQIDFGEILRDSFVTVASIGLPLKCLGYPAGRILAWDGWAIDCIITDLALNLPNNISINPCYHAFSYWSPDNVGMLTNLLLQQVKFL